MFLNPKIGQNNFGNKIPYLLLKQFFFLLPDTRDPHCRAATYDDVLPKASIIIIFTNEAWSPLIRTVWSVLDNTEAEHLHEIILVDDFSDKTHLKGKLTRYIQKKFTSKVKLLRLKSRLVQFNHKPIIFVCCSHLVKKVIFL